MECPGISPRDSNVSLKTPFSLIKDGSWRISVQSCTWLMQIPGGETPGDQVVYLPDPGGVECPSWESFL
jgi:hypothetical protein